MLVEVYRARQNRRIKKAEEKLAKRIFDDISHADIALPPEIQEKYGKYIRESSASIRNWGSEGDGHGGENSSSA